MEATKQPLILALIVTYNGVNYIRQCLQSLLQGTAAEDIIVVDNGSTDGTGKLIETEYAGITLIRLPENYGFGRANNLGLQLALGRGADQVFLLNQDVYVEKGTLADLGRLAELHPGYGILSPIHLNGRGTGMDKAFIGYASFFIVSDLYLDKVKPVYECGFVNAAAWLVSRRCLETVGGFDRLFFHYGEDFDYTNRVRYFKLKIGVCPAVRIRHDRGPAPAFAGYPAARKFYIEALGRLKDINVPFGKAVGSIWADYWQGLVVSFFGFQFGRMALLTRIFLRLAVRFSRIRLAREKCQQGGYGLGEDAELQSYLAPFSLRAVTCPG